MLSGRARPRARKGSMRTPPLFAALLLGVSLLLGGCAGPTVSLQEVRDFADQSAKLGTYNELSTRYRDTYAREQLYLAPAADKLGKETDAKRRAVYEDFVSAQKAVVLYMQTLSQLAGADRFDLGDRLDDLGNGITADLDSGRDQQTLLDAMLTLTRLYAKTHENEKKTILGIFDVEIPMAGKPQDRMLVTLAKVHYLSKATEYKILDKRYELAVQGLTKVSLGHQKLREHLDDLQAADIKAMIASYAKDLQAIRLGLAAP